MTRSCSPSIVACLLAVGVLLATLPACTQPTAVKPSDDARTGVESPWPRASAALRKETDLVAARRVMAQLTSDLALSQDQSMLPEGLDPATAATLRQTLGLTEAEIKEITSASFSELDANYLAECLYLRDAARSLEPAGHSPARQAGLAFAWVCRQVVLNPWELLLQQPDGQQSLMQAIVPVTYILQRGPGSGLERAYVFLALATQLGLDACLVGAPDSATRPAVGPYLLSADPKPRGPFWAVGVRVGPDILLFDPWRGEPLPGPEGTGIATLAQVKANADQLKSWREEKSRPWPVSADEVKLATPYLAVPLSAAAPRMRRLERELAAEVGVRLAIDPAALAKRFASEKSPVPAFWNPPGDQSSYTRVLISFLPAESGGTATDQVIQNEYRKTTVPMSQFLVHPQLFGQGGSDIGVPEAVTRIQLRALGEFFEGFLSPPLPREQIQRGQFAEVTPVLVQRRQHFIAARERIRTDRDREQAVLTFVRKAHDVFSALGRARNASPPNPVGLAEAQRNVEMFWQEQESTARALVDLAVAEAGYAEATYLLAQCMHEQAERAQARAELAAGKTGQTVPVERLKQKAAAAWSEARSWWRNYDEIAAGQHQAYPGRAEHARRLADRAAALAAR